MPHPKIAYVVDTFPRRSELFIRREIDELDRRGVSVTIFSVCRPASPDPRTVYLPRIGTVPNLTCAGIFARALDKHPKLLAARILRSGAAAELARAVSAGGFNVIHAHFLGVASTLGLAASKISDVPLTISAHARDIFVCGEAARAKAAHAGAVFTCCRANVEELVRMGVPNEKIRVSYHGLPEGFGADVTSMERQGSTILAAGRFVEKKGFGHLIRVLGALRLRGVDFRCTICGDGPLGKTLVESARLSGLAGTVDFPGWLSPDRMRDLYIKADIVVCPSVIAADGDRDGVPNIILEAMACGVPVVASNVGGIPEAVLDRSTGILVPPADRASLADAIEALADDADLRRSLSEGGRSIVSEKFNLSKNINELLDTWAASI